jgi:glucose-6-phosphate isomerase, archaeal
MKAMGGTVDLSDIAGLPVVLDPARLTLDFGDGIATEPLAQRRIGDIREMLPDPNVTGPDPLYSIYMDVRVPDLSDQLDARGLAYGAVVDSPGQIGNEFVRSQGHVHSSPAGTTTPYLEIYEFWYGTGAVYLQDAAQPTVTDVMLVDVSPGDKLIIPPGWVHVVVNTGSTPLAFGALYAADAVLMYDALRALNGTAWAMLADGSFAANPRYQSPPRPGRVRAAEYPAFGIVRDRPVLTEFAGNPGRYDYVVRPEAFPEVWTTVIQDLQAGSWTAR